MSTESPEPPCIPAKGKKRSRTATKGGKKPTLGNKSAETGPHASLLREFSMRPTRQRQVLAELLFGKGIRHLTADELHAEAKSAGMSVSLATVYNTLNQFTASGLLRQVVIDVNRAYFDTNVNPHHHFYLEESGILIDIADETLSVQGVPSVPEGTEVARVDVIIRVKARPPAS